MKLQLFPSLVMSLSLEVLFTIVISINRGTILHQTNFWKMRKRISISKVTKWRFHPNWTMKTSTQRKGRRQNSFPWPKTYSWTDHLYRNSLTLGRRLPPLSKHFLLKEILRLLKGTGMTVQRCSPLTLKSRISKNISRRRALGGQLSTRKNSTGQVNLQLALSQNIQITTTLNSNSSKESASYSWIREVPLWPSIQLSTTSLLLLDVTHTSLTCYCPANN